MLKPGDVAPDVVVKTLEGQDFPLATPWRKDGKHTLLIFLRHLG